MVLQLTRMRVLSLAYGAISLVLNLGYGAISLVLSLAYGATAHAGAGVHPRRP